MIFRGRYIRQYTQLIFTTLLVEIESNRTGFVRISVRIVDVQEAFFRVATDADLSRSITGGGGGGDFADWMRCLPAKSFRHDQLLFVVSVHPDEA